MGGMKNVSPVHQRHLSFIFCTFDAWKKDEKVKRCFRWEKFQKISIRSSEDIKTCDWRTGKLKATVCA